MRISIVVAQAHDRVIGRDGQLPWRLPGDLQRFKQLTMGHPLIMGRKTLASIGRLLPGRTTIVLTRDPAFDWPGAHIAHTWEQAVSLAAESCRAAGDVDEAFVVGGAEIYQLALPARRSYLSDRGRLPRSREQTPTSRSSTRPHGRRSTARPTRPVRGTRSPAPSGPSIGAWDRPPANHPVRD